MNIIPLPNEYKTLNGKFFINNKSSLNYSNEFKYSISELIKFIINKTNITFIKQDNANINFLLNLELPNESYILEILPSQITIHANNDQDAFYAVQSLKQLAKKDKQGNLYFECCIINDQPRFYYRSFMLDVARHFFDKNYIKKLIKVLALHKFNYLHLHLSDDQGFRIESTIYPELNKIGSVRYKTIRRDKSYDNKPHQGYYSKEDIIEIVSYAKENFIEIIPEIDIPGHSRALIASYNFLHCNNEVVDVKSDFGIDDNVICVSNPKTYEFLENLLDEIISLFPGKYFHIGSDEVKSKTWSKCSSCRKLMKANKYKNYKQLQTHFSNHFCDYLRSKGKIPIAWNDNITNETRYNLIMQNWTPYKQKNAIREINNGRYTIISNFFNLYLDYPYAMTPLEKVYNFEVILKSVIEKDYIIGVESPVWTEWINNINKLEYQVFPRLAAVSEIAWTNKHLKNYDFFCNRLKELYKIYDELNINYALNKEKKFNLAKRFALTLKWFKDDNIEYKK